MITPVRWNTYADGRARSLVPDRPRIIAILNVTPDSFSDGGSYVTVERAAGAAEVLLRDGADALDIGGESTRPGAAAVPAREQIRRTAPVIREIRRRLGDTFIISIDTTLADVADAALDAGADAINDTSAGRDDAGMLPLAARRGAGIVLMHRHAAPAGDVFSTAYADRGGERPSVDPPHQAALQAAPPAPRYQPDVVTAVLAFLTERVVATLAAGVPGERVMVDPGLGFGKSVEDNLKLIRGTRVLASLGYPVLSGLSRKSFVGRVAGVPVDRPPADRAAGTLALSVVHLTHGARIFRVHDVAAHAQALNAAWSVLRSEDPVSGG